MHEVHGVNVDCKMSLDIFYSYVLALAELSCSEHDLTAGKLQLNKCDIYKVLANGATLFGSQGAEYDIHDVDGIESIKQFIKQLIIACFGLKF